MRSIAVINQKGGVGKTTTAVNLGAALAEAGQRVCLMDLDPQAHASLHLGVALGEQEPSIYDVLTADATLADVRRQICNNLWVVPAHLNLLRIIPLRRSGSFSCTDSTGVGHIDDVVELI